MKQTLEQRLQAEKQVFTDEMNILDVVTYECGFKRASSEGGGRLVFCSKSLVVCSDRKKTLRGLHQKPRPRFGYDATR
jgi:hypothetical protein